MVLYQSALDFAATYPIDADFVVYVGDNVAHDYWNQTREENLEYAQVVHDALRTAFPKKMVLSTIGNHDTFRRSTLHNVTDLLAVDQLDTPPNGAWFLQPMTKIYSQLGLPQSALDTFEYAGYYSVVIRPGLRIVALNTQYADPLNFWVRN